MTSPSGLKRRYKRLSLKYHPDKRPSGTSQREAEERFIELTRAYKACVFPHAILMHGRLTDPGERVRYLKWGHPEGKRKYFVRIGLPISMVADENISMTLLVVYISMITVVPCWLGFWHFGGREKVKNGLYRTSAQRLFQDAVRPRKLDVPEIIGILSRCNEITDIIQAHRKRIDINELVDVFSSLPVESGEITGEITVRGI
jgi:translocation protein SEC63